MVFHMTDDHGDINNAIGEVAEALAMTRSEVQTIAMNYPDAKFLRFLASAGKPTLERSGAAGLYHLYKSPPQV